MKYIWSTHAWNDYLYWQETDRKTVKRINALIKDISRNGNDGIGKPEPLKYELSGYWLRRITDEHRLVYKYTDDALCLAMCRYHWI
ncbi:Txe/YoeB family addiction module toxin [Corynebacterium glucuronolyticum]|uniref:Endoribonuclease YoeB n=2 Tax=Corynebacterium glucuronolyticum TaxID=39791 RepID=A0AAX1L7U9_9CORY|nr:Txe/YoeB family addiction module toxin [Corynebacterium glucuronolyticum]EEI61827.1 addiction module toxin, Txe/YoeB family [Corynebacterium glucuronolyticum ATCC 51866]QRP70528.1 Txe/YoeB family addiction module toxin [Corynebacterium glucuronolyticum]